MKIARAQEKYEKDRSSAQAKAIEDLRRTSLQSSERFAPRQLHAAFEERSLADPATSTPERSPINDVFLSHASEDKDDIARPLKDALEARGVSVWFDELKIKVGQSIRQEIEAGIAG